MPEELMVTTEDLDRLGHRLRQLMAKTFGEAAEQVVSSRHKEAYRAIVASLLADVKVRGPKQIVRGSLRYGRRDGNPWGAWIEGDCGIADFYLTDLGLDGDFVEIVILDPVKG
jgi:hypothetical protein